MNERPVFLTDQQLRRVVRETIKSEMAPKSRALRNSRAPQALAQLGVVGIAQGDIANNTVGTFKLAKGPPGSEAVVTPNQTVSATNITGGQINDTSKLLLIPVALRETGPKWYAIQQTHCGADDAPATDLPVRDHSCQSLRR